MHRFVHTGEITVGSYVQAQKVEVRLKNMVFLVVLDVKRIGWNDEVCKMHAAKLEVDAVKVHEEEECVEKGKSPMGASTSMATRTPTKPRSAPSDQRRNVEDAFANVDARTFPIKETPSKPPGGVSNKPPLPIALPRDWHDLQTPLKLTTLRAIPSLPYRQNWSCNVLAIIASVSSIEPCKLSPGKQRTALVTDPSTAKQVHLTVFLDPDEFTPKVGSAVLLTGVKNHRFDGGSLRKYASDKGQGRWWFEDPWDLKWCNVKEIKAWWAELAELEAYFASPLGEETLD